MDESRPDPLRSARRETPSAPTLGRRRWLLPILAPPLALLVLELCLAVLARLHALAGTGSGASRGAIVCAGDSNTAGVGAPEGRSYPDQLRALLRADGDLREVVNLGRSGLPCRLVVDRLQQFLGRGEAPSFVVFLGGQNDLTRTDLFLELEPGRGSGTAHALRRLLRGLRTYRALEGLLAQLTGRAGEGMRTYFDAAPPELRYAAEDDDSRLTEAIARGEVRGAAALLHSLRIAWRQERPEETAEAARRLFGSPAFATFGARFRHPLEVYAWDIEMLAGRTPEPIVPRNGEWFPSLYAAFISGYADLVHGRFAEARGAFKTVRGSGDPYFDTYVRLHAAWSHLLERDFDQASEELRRVLGDALALSPKVSPRHALGGAALSHLLRREDTRLEPWREPFRAEWEAQAAGTSCPIGREWMAVAEWANAAKSDDPQTRRAIAQRWSGGSGEVPRTAALRYLLAHPDATWRSMREELPLEPPRASYLGPFLHWHLFRNFDAEETDRLLEPAFRRLADLGAREGFRTLVTTYLDPRNTFLNERIRTLAEREGLSILDLQARYGALLGEKGRYFSSDLHHPNEAGYGLVARAVYERIRSLEGRR